MICLLKYKKKKDFSKKRAEMKKWPKIPWKWRKFIDGKFFQWEITIVCHTFFKCCISDEFFISFFFQNVCIWTVLEQFKVIFEFQNHLQLVNVFPLFIWIRSTVLCLKHFNWTVTLFLLWYSLSAALSKMQNTNKYNTYWMIGQWLIYVVVYQLKPDVKKINERKKSIECRQFDNLSEDDGANSSS